jgi:predicted  nucleic acid-binding Zn-ribbon protein
LVSFDGLTYSFLFTSLQGLILSKSLGNKRNVKGEAARKEIVKLRSEVSGLRFDCEENEKYFKILENDFFAS